MDLDELDSPSSGDRRTRVALARLYDVDLLEDPGDLDVYLALAERAARGRRGAEVLELGVGSGRIAVALASAGHDVAGVDLDEEMLARARERSKAAGRRVASRLELVRADMTDPELGGILGNRRFDLAILALNSLLLLPDRDAQASALRAMAGCLAPGGLAIVDVWLPDAEDLARYDGRSIVEYVRPDPGTQRLVTKLGSAVHDAATATVSLTTIYEEGGQGEPAIRWIRRDRLRLVGSGELRRMTEEAGLEVEVLAGGYDLNPLRPGDDRAVLVARLAERPERTSGAASHRRTPRTRARSGRGDPVDGRGLV